jgi:hypothetical protein
MDWDRDRDLQLLFIQFKDVPLSYSIEVGSANETVDDIKEKIRKEYPYGRHIRPHETLVYRGRELRDGHLMTDYNLPVNATVYVAERDVAPSHPKNPIQNVEDPWDLGLIQSVKHKLLLPVDLLAMDEAFYNNPFAKPENMYVTPNSIPSPNLSGLHRKMVDGDQDDEMTRVCDKRARVSPPPDAAGGSNPIKLGIGEFSAKQCPSAGFGLAKKRGRPLGSKNKNLG